MAKELLSPDFTIEYLQKRLVDLQEALEKKRKGLKELPEGHLRIAQTSNKPQYYHYIEPKDFKGVFIPRTNDEFARKLAQKDYDLKVVKLLENEINAISRCLRQLYRGGRLPTANSSTATKLGDLYAKMCPARQRLITPVTFTAEQYAKQWLSVTWPRRSFSPDTAIHTTASGIQVRSKSEVLIAEALTRHNIPFRYEYPLKLRRPSGDIVTFHPDFLCLNVVNRTEFYWEHFGLMDNPDYSNNAAGKLRLYTENGIITGHNLIITMETQNEPLTTQLVEKIIKELLTN